MQVHQIRREERIAAVLDDCLLRRHRGEIVSDASVIDSHPELMPELAAQLRLLDAMSSATRRTEPKLQGLRIRCPDCHSPILVNEESGLSHLACESCGHRFGLVDDGRENLPAAGEQTIGRFQLVEKLGTGAFGSVWRAHDTKLDRQVAIKIPRKTGLNLEDIQAFVREARVSAQLNHPNIVAVHEVGREGDYVYMVTDLISGCNLSTWIRENKATQDEAVRICSKLASALDHAHQQGVTHRDVKPSNILVDTTGQVFLTDFGLAKRDLGEVTMTMDGKLLGTPDYMSPEQARGSGHSADGRSDIYSLGVVFFELLTGERPFRGDTRMVLSQTLTMDAPSPRKLRPRIHRDLETICLKCLEKEANKRFQTAAELREEFERFLRREPIKARSINQIERGWRWVRRNRLVSALISAVCCSLFIVTLISTWAALKINQHRREASQQAANLALDRGSTLCQQGNVATGLLWIARALEFSGTDDQDLQHAIRVNLSSWSKLISPLVATLPHQARVTSVAISPSSEIVITGSLDGTAKLWHARSGDLIAKLEHGAEVTCVAISPDGKRAITGSHDSTAKIWDTATGAPAGPTLIHPEGVTSVAFSQDSNTVLTGSIDVLARLWDVATGRLRGEPMRHGAAIKSANFSPGDEKLITIGGSQAKLWDARTGAPIGGPLDHPMEVRSAVVSADGKTLLTGSGSEQSRKGEARLWNLESGALKAQPIEFDSVVPCVAMSPDGNAAIAGSQSGTVRLWNVVSGEAIGQTQKHEFEVKAVAFSSDGKRFITGSFDGTARLWDVATGEPLGTALQHYHHVYSLAFSQDTQIVVTGSEDGAARVWDVSRNWATSRLLRGTRSGKTARWSLRLQFSPNGRQLLTGDQHGMARLVNVHDGEQDGPEMTHSSKITALSFRPDGEVIGVGCEDGSIRFWDIRQRQLIGGGKHDAGITEVTFSPDGQFAASAGHDGTARLWDAATGQEVGEPLRHAQAVWYVSFRHDSRRLVTSSGDGSVREWEVASRQPLGPELCHPFTPWEAKFSRKAGEILTSCGPSAGKFGEARIWDVRNNPPTFRTFPHAGAVSAVSLSSDGRLVLTGSFDHTAQLWDVDSGRPARSPFLHTDRVWDVAFSPDGQVVLTASDDRTVRLWDVRTGKPLGAPFVHPVSVHNAVFSSDNTTVATGAMDDMARLWHRPTPLSGDARKIRLWVQRLTGLALDAVGVPRQLDKLELQEIDREFKAISVDRW